MKFLENLLPVQGKSPFPDFLRPFCARNSSEIIEDFFLKFSGFIENGLNLNQISFLFLRGIRLVKLSRNPKVKTKSLPIFSLIFSENSLLRKNCYNMLKKNGVLFDGLSYYIKKKRHTHLIRHLEWLEVKMKYLFNHLHLLSLIEMMIVTIYIYT